MIIKIHHTNVQYKKKAITGHYCFINYKCLINKCYKQKYKKQRNRKLIKFEENQLYTFLQ